MFKKSNKPNKYRNTKFEALGIKWDSKREYQRYLFLKEAQDKGLISDLELQPKFELIPAIREKYIKHLKTKDKECERVAQMAVTYTADFGYIKDGVRVIEDVKISPKMLPPEFILRKKMMKYFHNIDVRCVYKPTESI